MNIFKNSEGKAHRTDGPAIITSSGDKYWYKNGKKHRENGPAVEYANGARMWYLNDYLHREDGPAVIWANGDISWFLHGKRYESLQHFCQALSHSPKCSILLLKYS